MKSPLFEQVSENSFKLIKEDQSPIKEGMIGDAAKKILKKVIDWALKINPKLKDEMSKLKGPEDIKKILQSGQAKQLMQKYSGQTNEGLLQKQLPDGRWQPRVSGVALAGLGLTGLLVLLTIIGQKYGFFTPSADEVGLGQFSEAVWMALKLGLGFTAGATGIAQVQKMAANADDRKAKGDTD